VLALLLLDRNSMAQLNSVTLVLNFFDSRR
jgi:hypothetical protein